jgi:hypothetical protein
MNLNLLLNFSKLDGFMTPYVSGRSNNAKTISFNENRKTLANELMLDSFEDFNCHEEKLYHAEHFGEFSPKATPRGPPMSFKELIDKHAASSPKYSETSERRRIIARVVDSNERNARIKVTKK